MGKNKKRVILLAFILSIITFIYILIVGQTYTYRFYSYAKVKKIDINLKNNLVEVIDKKTYDNYIEVKFKAKKSGKESVTIKTDKFNSLFNLYINKLNIITLNSRIGELNGGKILFISTIIFLLYILYIMIKKLRISVRENLYKYKNIAILSIIFYIIISIIILLLYLIHKENIGISSFAQSVLGIYGISTLFILPVAFVLSIFISISNIILVVKEGFNIRNILGLLLGLIICFFSLFPELFYRINHAYQLVNIYNLNSAGPYIYNFFESLNHMVLIYIELILVSTIIFSIKAARHIPKFNKDFIIILGCQIKKDGTLTNLLKSRVDRAIEFSKMQKEATGKDIIFIPSGGKGDDEIISEGEAIKDYLISCNIKEENILVENKSKNTYENINFSKKLIEKKNKNSNVAFSTTNYHVFRSGVIASEVINDIEGIGSKTKVYFWLNAFIREFIATIFYEFKKHLLVLLLLSIVNILLVIIQYISVLI